MASGIQGFELAEKVISLCRGKVAQAEAFAMETEHTPIVFENNRLKSAETRSSVGVTLRVIRDGRLGMASAMGPTDPHVLIDRALSMAPYGPEVHFQFADSRLAQIPDGIYSPATSDLPHTGMIGLGREVIGTLLEQRPELMIDVHVQRSVEKVCILTSLGGHSEYLRSALKLSVHVNRVSDTDLLDVYDEVSAVHPLLDVGVITERIAQRVAWADRVVKAPQGNVPVVLTPKGAAMLFLGPLRHFFNGKSVLEGSSPLVGRVGETLFHGGFSLVDVGVVPGVAGSRPVDDEGFITGQLQLVTGGRVVGFYYDLQTAHEAGTRPTGHGSRGPGGYVQPGPNLWIFPTGDLTFDDLLRRSSKGVLIDQVMGAWASNVMAGEFSGNVHLGYAFEDGVILGRIKNAMIAGKVMECLSREIAFGSDTQWINGSVQVPSLWLEAVSLVAGR